MILRCRVVDDAWWIAYQTEDGKKITPVEPTVVAFQNVDIRDVPPFWQILPCPYCGSETDRHDPIQHVDTHLLGNEVVVLRKDVKSERIQSLAQTGRSERYECGGIGSQDREPLLHLPCLLPRGGIVDGGDVPRIGMARSFFVPRWRRVVFLFDAILNALEYLSKRVIRIRFRLLSENKGSK